MRVAVTGANGFIGRNLAKALHHDGHAVRALIRRPEKAATLAGVGLEIRIAPLEDGDALAEALQGVEALCHLANVMVFALPRTQWATNVEGTRRLLAAARRAGVDRVLYVSSVSVYGQGEAGVTEGAARRPTTHYGRTKVVAEDLVREAFPAAGQILRPGVVYGPGAPLLYHLLRRGPTLVGNGANWVPFVHVVDMVRAALAVLERGPPAAVYNVVDDVPLQMETFLSLVAREAGRPLRRVPYPLAFLAATGAEAWARLRGRAPRLTRDVLRLYGTSLTVSNRRLRTELDLDLAHPDPRRGLPAALRAVEATYAV